MKIFLLIVSAFTLLFAQSTARSPHGAKLNIACKTCHTTNNWQDSTALKFDHNQTGYALIGGHKDTECISCHKSLVFSRIGIMCADCHSDIHKGELGIECQNCHNSMSWKNRSDIFEQHLQTNFPLLGAHANLDCESCHQSEQQRQYTNTPVSCQGCHLSDYISTTNPSHQQVNFSLECNKCHLPNAATWHTTIFNHPQTFPLIGGHSGIECLNCHSDGFSSITTDCYSCHKQDYDQSQNPNHLIFGFPTTCEHCHSGVSWERNAFNHNAESGFAIEGAHLNILCTDCHVNNQLTGLARDCFGCHKEDYNTATNPNHLSNQFELDCLACHSLNSWTPAEFDHNNTDFVLTGAHSSLNCMECHSEGYSNTPSACWSCHELDYRGTEDPNHVSNGYDHDCLNCHTTANWSATAGFNHTITNFELTGAHTSLACQVCHSNGYTNTPMECVACHQQDYNQTVDPHHANAQLPLSCENCHNTISWKPANWDHDGQYFPVYSGAHREKWDTCSDCHTNSSDYGHFSCVNCHDHNRSEMAEKHKEVNSYSYESNACYDCHPDGKSDD